MTASSPAASTRTSGPWGLGSGCSSSQP
jgi:hypothetical protein